MDKETILRLPLVILADTIVSGAMDGIRQLKLAAVANGPADIPPRVLFLPVDRHALIDTMIAQFTRTPIPMPDLVGYVLRETTIKYGDPLIAGMASDCHGMIGEATPESEAIVRGLHRGDLAKAFEAEVPGVTEMLTVQLMHLHEGKLRTLLRLQPYHYGDGSVIFDEEILIDSLVDGYSPGGAVTDVIRNHIQKGTN